MKLKLIARMIFLFGALAASAAAQDCLGSGSASSDAPYAGSARLLRNAGPGFGSLLSDIYWIRTILYFGRSFERSRSAGEPFDFRSLDQLQPLLEATVELDPRQVSAYRFGAFFLQFSDREKAIEFARRGIAANPEEWSLYQDLGLVYWNGGRFGEAAAAYEAGAGIAGAPEWMKPMAATMVARGGDRRTAIEIFNRLRQETRDPFVREVCEQQLRLLGPER